MISERELASKPIDVLIMVSNTPSMCDLQTELIESLTPLVRELVDGRDARVGVIDSDMVSSMSGIGRLRREPGPYLASGCTAEAPDLSHCTSSIGPVLSVNDYRNGDENIDLDALTDDLSCLVATGDSGTPIEMGLSAVELALARPTSELLRANAHLAVILVSNGDDCSDGTLPASHGPVYERAVAGEGLEACDAAEDALIPVEEIYERILDRVAAKNWHQSGLDTAASEVDIYALVNTGRSSGAERTSAPLSCGSDTRRGNRYLALAALNGRGGSVGACDPATNGVTELDSALEALLGPTPFFGPPVDTICLPSRPRTCAEDSDCPGDQACAPKIHFHHSANLAYRLCDGFDVRVAVSSVSEAGADGEACARELARGLDFELDFEARGCIEPDGTGSPVAIHFSKPLSPGSTLSIASPKYPPRYFHYFPAPERDASPRWCSE